MAVSILEALQNADYNLNNSVLPIQVTLGKDQLHNAVVLLDNGYSLEDEVEPLLEKYGSIDRVPRKE